jgi:ferredoxin
MKVKVDQLKCATVGVCVKICPEVFRFQEGSKKATVMLDPIPVIHWEKCLRAARECPNKAVIIQEQPGVEYKV